MNSTLRLVIIALTLAAGVGLGAYGVRLRGEREEDRDRRAVLQARIAVLDGRVRALEEQAGALLAQIAQQSNVIRSTEARYQEERQTHEPLRAQIEKMQMQKIADDGRLRRQADDLTQARLDLDSRGEEARKAGEENRALKEQVAAMEAARQEVSRGADDVRKRLKAAEARAGQLAQRITELETGLAQAQSARDEAEKKRAALAEETEALRRASAPPPAAASTNAPPAQPAVPKEQGKP